MANVYTLKLTSTQEDTLRNTWKENLTTPPQYAKWQLKCENCVITCYTSGKTVFQGKEANVYASPFLPHKQTQMLYTHETLPQAGSDEVGTGDYFGPVVVCACIVDQNTDVLLKKLGTRDSKQLTDKDICMIAPQLLTTIPYSLLIVENEKYNAVHQVNNLNAIKAKLHNQAYVHLANKYGLPSFKIIDQFTPEKSYYRYIAKEPTIIHNIHFETKAEDKYPSVGAASVIARYAFLKKMEQMEQQWDMSFPKGAGAKVDAAAIQFVKKYGFAQLSKVAKMHFKNTEKVLIE